MKSKMSYPYTKRVSSGDGKISQQWTAPLEETHIQESTESII